MTAALNKMALFKWRAASYFFAALFMTLGGSFSTSNGGTTTKDWIIAGVLACGSAFAALKGFLDTAASDKENEN
jgi:Trk-type K+ transport system membrane component